MSHVSRRVLRQWQILEFLTGKRRGATRSQIEDELAVSRATVYRDLEVLQEILPIEKIVQNGETRYRLGTVAHVLKSSPLLVQALNLARRQLEPLAGSSLVRALDGLIEQAAGVGFVRDVSISQTTKSVDKDIIKAVEAAIRSQVRLQLFYRGANDPKARERLIEPVELRVWSSEAYCTGWDVEAAAWRTFKLARATKATKLKMRSRFVDGFDAQAVFKDSLSVWSEDSIDVVVRISAEKAHLTTEYPLGSSQTIVDEPCGAKTVRAKVAGEREALQWILKWGRSAEVLAPSELRSRIAGELEDAAALYRSSQLVETDNP